MKIKPVFILILIFTISIGSYILYKQLSGKRDISKETAAFCVNANDLFREFQINEAAASKKYTNQVVEVKGVIAEIIKDQGNSFVIILKEKDEIFGINCSINNSKNSQALFNPGDSIRITGIVQGYMDDVILNNCIINKSNR